MYRHRVTFFFFFTNVARWVTWLAIVPKTTTTEYTETSAQQHSKRACISWRVKMLEVFVTAESISIVKKKKNVTLCRYMQMKNLWNSHLVDMRKNQEETQRQYTDLDERALLLLLLLMMR